MSALKNHHLIFEGPELVGKSFVIAQIYDFLEKKHNSPFYQNISREGVEV